MTATNVWQTSVNVCSNEETAKRYMTGHLYKQRPRGWSYKISTHDWNHSLF